MKFYFIYYIIIGDQNQFNYTPQLSAKTPLNTKKLMNIYIKLHLIENLKF